MPKPARWQQPGERVKTDVMTLPKCPRIDPANIFANA
jgi:hypothetical protein